MDFEKRIMKSKQLTVEQRYAILQCLIKQIKDENKLSRGAIQEVAGKFEVSRLTVSRIWHKAKKQYDEGNIFADVSSNKERCGRKRKDYSEQLNKIKDIPLNFRSTIRSLSCATEVPKSTLYRRFKEGNHIKRISSTVNPMNQNEQGRLQFCLSKVKSNEYFDFDNYVHIDEKWFYLTKEKRSLYVTLDEEIPGEMCKSDGFITKVMFMAAVARPRYDTTKKQYFDGKIGLWPFIYKEPAKRNTKTHAKGTLVTKNIELITETEFKKMMIENVLPAIKTKFPIENKSKPIFVQQGTCNAKPHSSDIDAVLLAEGSKDGWCIQFKSQPPNSLDLNVLDLGFVNSIESLKHQASPKTIDELIDCVQNAFNELKLEDVFLTLQRCMDSIIIAKGENSQDADDTTD